MVSWTCWKNCAAWLFLNLLGVYDFCLIDWLIDWLIGWLVDWLIDCEGLCYIGEDLLMVSDTDNHLLRMINLKTQRYQDSFYQAEHRAISNDKMWTFYFYMLLNLTWLKNPIWKVQEKLLFFFKEKVRKTFLRCPGETFKIFNKLSKKYI